MGFINGEGPGEGRRSSLAIPLLSLGAELVPRRGPSGCFSVEKKLPFSLTFSLSQKYNTALMKAIQEFFDSLNINHSNTQTIVSASYDKRIASKGEISNLYITRVNYITDVLIPFFDSLS